jgi:hypothetical protein
MEKKLLIIVKREIKKKLRDEKIKISNHTK